MASRTPVAPSAVRAWARDEAVLSTLDETQRVNALGRGRLNPSLTKAFEAANKNRKVVSGTPTNLVAVKVATTDSRGRNTTVTENLPADYVLAEMRAAGIVTPTHRGRTSATQQAEYAELRSQARA